MYRKTAVAAAAVYFVVKNGYRAAIMAPTEILARQHYNFLKPIFSKLGISVCFLSGSVKNAEKRELIFQLKNGFFDVVIGTHSLLYVEGEIPDLSFVVEDEQHRFGVAQRTGLICKGVGVDVLTLSATPLLREKRASGLFARRAVRVSDPRRRRERGVSFLREKNR